MHGKVHNREIKSHQSSVSAIMFTGVGSHYFFSLDGLRMSYRKLELNYQYHLLLTQLNGQNSEGYTSIMHINLLLTLSRNSS